MTMSDEIQWGYVAIEGSRVYHLQRATDSDLTWCGIDLSNARFQVVERDKTAKILCKRCHRLGDFKGVRVDAPRRIRS
jgi:hypothetical protein